MTRSSEHTIVDGGNPSSARGGARRVDVEVAKAAAGTGGTAPGAVGSGWLGSHPPPAAEPHAGAVFGSPAAAPAPAVLRSDARTRRSPRWSPAGFETGAAATVAGECALGAPEGSCGSDLPHILAATVHALQLYPELNARWEDGDSVIQPRVDVGVMLSTPAGPAIPVVHDAGGLWGPELREVVSRVIRDAAEGRLRPGDFGRSTFSIAPAPRLGALLRAPLMRSPEVAILGVCHAHERPLPDGWVVRSARLACTFDSRAVSEEAAQAFLEEICAHVAHAPSAGPGALHAFGSGLRLGTGRPRRVPR